VYGGRLCRADQRSQGITGRRSRQLTSVHASQVWPTLCQTTASGGRYVVRGVVHEKWLWIAYTPNKRIALAPKRLEGYRHFINKVWNASRLVFELTQGISYDTPTTKPKGFFNRWILSRMAETITAASAGIGGFRVDETANEIYRFFWNDFCDWYLEITKPLLRQTLAEGEKPSELLVETRLVILHVLETSFRLMHPLMPYVTEELWQRMPKPKGRQVSIAFGPYPDESHVGSRLPSVAHVVPDDREWRGSRRFTPPKCGPRCARRPRVARLGTGRGMGRYVVRGVVHEKWLWIAYTLPIGARLTRASCPAPGPPSLFACPWFLSR
jgi:hypothetical protein